MCSGELSRNTGISGHTEGDEGLSWKPLREPDQVWTRSVESRDRLERHVSGFPPTRKWLQETFLELRGTCQAGRNLRVLLEIAG